MTTDTHMHVHAHTHTHTHMRTCYTRTHTHTPIILNSVHVCTGLNQLSNIPDKVQKGDGLSTLSIRSTELQNHIQVFSITISSSAHGGNAQSTTSMKYKNGVL